MRYNKLNLPVVIFLTLIISGCDAPRPEFSIKINGAIASLADPSQTILNGNPVESSLENPIVSGTVSIGDVLARQGPDGYCCRRVLLNATGNSSNLMSGLFVRLGGADNRGSNWIHDFEATSISLPADHSPIEVSIQVGNNTYLHSTVKLKNDVIVIPVYAHVFTANDNSRIFSETQLAACFDLPNFTSSAVSVDDPNNTAVRITTYNFPNYAPPDTIWKQAGIQFRLMSVNYINDAAFNGQIIGPSGLSSTLVSGYHAQNNLNVNGFHIYFGGDTRNLEPEAQTMGPSPLCNVNTIASRSNHIAMQFDASPYALSHEIGHLLGLKHVDEADANLVCGGGLLGNSAVNDNLMKTRSFVNKLSQEQIAFARTVACNYLQLWNMPNTACTNP